MTFTASNGSTVERDHNGDVLIDRDQAYISLFMRDGTALALREFFAQERDEELGRWRWPENPDYVVYPKCDGWIVLSERSVNSKHYSHREHAQVGSSPLTLAMRAYLEAHPERKPWHDAKPGEVWVIEQANAVPTAARAGFVNERMKFEPVNNITRHIDVDDPVITDARRIWPESD